MTITLLLSTAATLIGLGQSPLAEPDARHDWVEVPNQAEDEVALHDRNWAETIELDGRTLTLALMRVDMSEDGAAVVMDTIIAADCSASKLGLAGAYFFQSPMGNDIMVPIDEIEMDLAAEPPGDDDRAILNAACGRR